MSIRKLTGLLTVIAATAIGAATANATNLGTWVSNNGTDTNNTACSISAPCGTFAHALTETASGGEINCLTSGYFGPFTINKSVTINCDGVSNASIVMSANQIGINVDTAGITVNLIGLDINGEGSTGATGVYISAPATVNIRNCKMHGLLYGGSGEDGAGIVFQPGASGGSLVVDNVLATGNEVGIWQDITTGAANMTVRNSNINNNIFAGIWVNNGGTHAGATIEQTTLAFNGESTGGYGLYVTGSGAVAVIGGSTIVNNSNGVNASGGGAVYSFKNNKIGGNSADGTPLTAYPGGPLN